MRNRRMERKLTRMLNACETQEEARALMKRLGFVELPPMTIAEAYHDAVKRNEDPEEIAWLREQWMSDKGEVRQ